VDPAGKIAVVTGASGGIGGALVRALVTRGARTVIAADIDPQGVTAQSAQSADGRVLPRALDVADEAATKTLVDEIEGSVGPIDVFFANAGVATGGGPEAPDDIWARQWSVNVMSHVYAARALLPGWTERGEGHLVTTASMAGLLSSLGDGVYSATKHAALGLAEWLAISYAAQGIKVSCICPGAVDTAMLRAGGGGDAARASAIIGGGDVLSPDQAADRILDELAEDRFLILTHPEMHDFVVVKAQEPERWIRGMTRLWGRAQALLSSRP
jgi:NAD(P)-dependent dehydrogenase (short-subunit alcohol dehydrogenase family)